MPYVTFDQQLYVLAYDIVSSKNMDMFVRLGGFHQIMSFLGSIGLLMSGSGLRSALETLYASVTVGHMFTGMAYSRAWSPIVCISNYVTDFGRILEWFE